MDSAASSASSCSSIGLFIFTSSSLQHITQHCPAKRMLRKIFNEHPCRYLSTEVVLLFNRLINESSLLAGGWLMPWTNISSCSLGIKPSPSAISSRHRSKLPDRCCAASRRTQCSCSVGAALYAISSTSAACSLRPK